MGKVESTLHIHCSTDRPLLPHIERFDWIAALAAFELLQSDFQFLSTPENSELWRTILPEITDDVRHVRRIEGVGAVKKFCYRKYIFLF